MLVSSKNSCQFIAKLCESNLGHLYEQGFSYGSTVAIVKLIGIPLLKSSVEIVTEIGFLANDLTS